LKILFTPLSNSSIAHVIRSLAVADTLTARGHECFFTSDLSKSKFIEDQGYKVVKTFKGANINDPSDQSVNFLVSHKNEFVKHFRAEIEATKEVKPDVIVMTGGIWGPYAHHATKVPIISIIDSQYLQESKGIMGISYSNDNFLHKSVRGLIKPIFEKKFIELYADALNDIYHEIGVNIKFKSRNELYKPMLKIIPSDHVLEPIDKEDNNIKYVGPLFWNGFENMETDLTEEYILKFKSNKNLFYITFGGSIFDKNIYSKVIKSLSSINGKFIICFGPNWESSDFPKDSDKMIFRKYVPGLRLSKLAEIIINTGSQGSVSQGLFYGKPQIAIPTIMDQAFFANRLEELKSGINVNKIPLYKFSKREAYSVLPKDLDIFIVKAINKILHNNSYKKNAEKHKKIIREYHNPPLLAAKIIEEYVNKSI